MQKHARSKCILKFYTLTSCVFLQKKTLVRNLPASFLIYTTIKNYFLLVAVKVIGGSPGPEKVPVILSPSIVPSIFSSIC